MKVLGEAGAQKDLPDPRLDLFFTKADASRKAAWPISAGSKRGPSIRNHRRAANSQGASRGADWLVRDEGRRRHDPAQDYEPGSDRERQQRHDAARGQFLCNVLEAWECTAHSLSQLGSRLAFSYPQLFVAHAELFLSDGRAA